LLPSVLVAQLHVVAASPLDLALAVRTVSSRTALGTLALAEDIGLAHRIGPAILEHVLRVVALDAEVLIATVQRVTPDVAGVTALVAGLRLRVENRPGAPTLCAE
jgi:hypothetical protein